LTVEKGSILKSPSMPCVVPLPVVTITFRILRVSLSIRGARLSVSFSASSLSLSISSFSFVLCMTRMSGFNSTGLSLGALPVISQLPRSFLYSP
jgi:hypothetical protein